MKFDIKNLNVLQALNLNRFEKSAIFIIAIIAFIGINILLSTITLREDLSQGKAYTLSQSTKNIISKTKDTVTITFFASSDIPSRLLPLKNDVTDLLNEYARQSRNVRVKIVDPKKSEANLNETKTAGIPELQFSQLDQDKYAVTASYFGILIANGTKKEVIPQVTDIESLEYNVTAALYKVTQKDLGKIGIINPDESAQLGQPDPLQSVRSVLQQQFTVEDIALATDSGKLKIDPSYKSILVLGVTNREFTPEETDAIKTYIDNKGKGIFFVDGVWVTEDLQTTPAKTNLESLLGEYGIKVNNDLVLSAQSEFVNFGTQESSYMAQYPFWIKTDNFNTQTSYFSNISQLTYPWVSSIALSQKSAVTSKALVKSTNQSWNQTKDFTLSPQTITNPDPKSLKEFVVSAESEKKNGGKIAVISASRFAQDRFIPQTANNIGLLLNVLNDYASDGALTGVRQRAVNFYPLPQLTENEKDIAKYTTILIMPVIFALYGAWRILKRK